MQLPARQAGWAQAAQSSQSDSAAAAKGTPLAAAAHTRFRLVILIDLFEVANSPLGLDPFPDLDRIFDELEQCRDRAHPAQE